MGFREAAKAWLAGLAAAIGYFIGVLDPSAIGLAAFAAVTTVQWLAAAGAVLGAYGIVYATPNAYADRSDG